MSSLLVFLRFIPVVGLLPYVLSLFGVFGDIEKDEWPEWYDHMFYLIYQLIMSVLLCEYLIAGDSLILFVLSGGNIDN